MLIKVISITKNKGVIIFFMKNIVLTGLIFYENIGDHAVFEITKELIMEMQN